MPCTKSKPVGFGWEQETKERNFALALSQKLDKQLQALAWLQQWLFIHCLSIFFIISTMWGFFKPSVNLFVFSEFLPDAFLGMWDLSEMGGLSLSWLSWEYFLTGSSRM